MSAKWVGFTWQEGDEGTGCRWDLKGKPGEAKHWVYSCRQGENKADHVSGLLAELDAYAEEQQREDDPVQLLGQLLWQQGAEEDDEADREASSWNAPADEGTAIQLPPEARCASQLTVAVTLKCPALAHFYNLWQLV